MGRPGRCEGGRLRCAKVAFIVPPIASSPLHHTALFSHFNLVSLSLWFLLHLQVATRFLSSSPAVYWFAAHMATYFLTGPTESDTRTSLAVTHAVKKHPTNSQNLSAVIAIWAMSALFYGVAGTLLFINFYPFT